MLEAEPHLIVAYEGLIERQETIPKGAGTRVDDALNRIISLYETWGKDEKREEWERHRDALRLADATATALVTEAKRFSKEGDVRKAIATFERAGKLPGQSPDLAALRSLYARNLEWDKAIDASRKIGHTTDWKTLAWMFAAGRYEEFRVGRRIHLAHQTEFTADYKDFHAVRIAVLLPIEPEIRPAVEALVLAESAPEVVEDFRCSNRRVAVLDADEQLHSARAISEAEPTITVVAEFEPNRIPDAITGLAAQHDDVICDAPARLSDETRAMMVMADVAIFPMEPTIKCLRSTKESIEVLSYARTVTGGKPEHAWLVLNKAKKRTRIFREVEKLAPSLGLCVANAPIRDLQAFPEADQQGTVVLRTRSDSPSFRKAKADLEGLFGQITELWKSGVANS